MSHYSKEQGDALIEACARAAHEAILAVKAVRRVHLLPWDRLPEEEREKLKHDAAHALDEIATADEEGATIEAYDKAVTAFGARAKLTPTRANLFLSVVAAVKKTLDDELPQT